MAKKPEKLEDLANQIKHLSESLVGTDASQLPTSRARSVRKTISETCIKLGKVMETLDPIKAPGFVFDPSNPIVVARIVGVALVAQPRKPLEKLERFYGSGVYALYYKGDFSPYANLSRKEHPIYVGKADPADPASKSAHEQGDRLAKRLHDHRKNIIKASETLKIEDFDYRVLVVQTGWQAAAEEYLIDLFKPIWNSQVKICYGFGKHGDDPVTIESPFSMGYPSSRP